MLLIYVLMAMLHEMLMWSTFTSLLLFVYHYVVSIVVYSYFVHMLLISSGSRGGGVRGFNPPFRSWFFLLVSI